MDHEEFIGKHGFIIYREDFFSVQIQRAFKCQIIRPFISVAHLGAHRALTQSNITYEDFTNPQAS